MPELPEVESQARDLRKWVLHRPICQVWVGWKKSVATPNVKQFIQQLKGQRITKIERRGKFILMYLSGGKVLVSHFRMTGHFRLASIRDSKSPREWYNYPADRFTRVAFKLDRDQILHYSDIRKFGRLWLVPKEQLATLPELKDLGPEPLSKDFSPKKFAECVRDYSGMIKPVLLKQTCVAGIGNIYADESLFDAGIHPKTRVERLRDPELRLLGRMVIANLSAALGHRGSSVGEFINMQGEPGKHGFYLRVYGQKGKPCQRRRSGKPCGGTVKRIVVGQRGTHICPVCQRQRK
ncbi:MAG: bifunctional DNA-formamidopyrimidine glycosylase/DNA-(apurinic or apyrimidinic site) lyase [Parcubacteria group bacterium]